MKVLYVCPLARLTGHPPFECTKETRIMKEQGIDVELLTFSGVDEIYVPHVPVLKVMTETNLFRKMRKSLISQWLLRVFEYSTCIIKACFIAKDRPIYLRDGEPFHHLVHLVNVFARKKWVISLTGGLYTTTAKSALFNVILRVSGVYLPFWYKIGKSRITYTAQNKNIAEVLKKLVGDNIHVVPLGHKLNNKQNQIEARNDLNLDGKLTIMNFGVSHSGKDNETIFKALLETSGIKYLHAGASSQSLGESPTELIKKYPIDALIKNYKIPEYMKQQLFGASDWVIMSYKKSFTSTPSMLWEACSYQVPVIASGDSELQEMVEKWGVGLLFEPGDSNSLKLALNNARDKTLHERMAKNCEGFINHYSESNWCNNVMRLLNA